MTKKNKSAIQRRLIPTYIFLIIVSFISVFPLYWMISAATNTSTDVSRGRIIPGSHFYGKTSVILHPSSHCGEHLETLSFMQSLLQ